MGLVINGEKVADSKIQREVERLRPHYERVFRGKDIEEREAQLLEWSRENVIEGVLLNQEAKKIGVQVSSNEIESAVAELKRQYRREEQFHEFFEGKGDEKIREDIEVQIRVERMLQDVCKRLPEPSEDVILEYYEANKEQFRSGEQIRVAHIVVHINGGTGEVEACDVIRKVEDDLKDGAVFEMLVAKYSDCPENGGDLGYIMRGQMVEEFDDVVFNLGIGEISEIFRTRFGFHIAKVYDRKAAVVRPLSDIKAEITDELKKEMRERAVDEFIDRLRGKAKIEGI